MIQPGFFFPVFHSYRETSQQPVGLGSSIAKIDPSEASPEGDDL